MSEFSGNAFTHRFGLAVPIVQGPMGGVAGPELVAAVANAGALGILPIWPHDLDTAMRQITDTQALTDRPFGVNLRADLVQEEHIKTAFEAGISLFHLFWGDPHASVAHIRTHGSAQADVKVLTTVGDADAARAALDAGASLLIAQGVEAGGHVLSETPLSVLLDEVLPLAGDVPVVAAGGLADAQDIADVMARGASGALLGTRFVATKESLAHDDYKQALLDAGADATARSICFDDGWENAPHRTLKNSTFEAWAEAGRPAPGTRPGEGEPVLAVNDMPIPRYSVMPPIKGMSGDIRGGAMYAGTGAHKVSDCPAVAEVIATLVSLLQAPDTHA